MVNSIILCTYRIRCIYRIVLFVYIITFSVRLNVLVVARGTIHSSIISFLSKSTMFSLTLSHNLILITLTCNGAVHKIDLVTDNSHDKLLLDFHHVDLKLNCKLKVTGMRDLRRMENIVEEVQH